MFTYLYNSISMLSNYITISDFIKGKQIDIVTNIKYILSDVYFLYLTIFILLMMLVYNKLELKNRASCSSKDSKMLKGQEFEIIVDNIYKLSFDSLNTVNQLQKLYKLKELTVESLTIIVKSQLELILTYLCETMQVLTKVKICACVKIVIKVRKNAKNFDNATLITMVRSKNTDSNRIQNDKNEIKISNNTDFFNIISQNNTSAKDYFYEEDLEEYSKKLKEVGNEYKNSNKEWLNYYKGTIVVPLKIANDKIFYSKKSDGFTLVGFLCIDSLEKGAFPLEKEKVYTNIMKIYSYMIFDILSKYKYYISKLD